KPIADFVEKSFNEVRTPAPDFVGTRYTRNNYYSYASSYRNYPSEGTYITVRGAMFTECYDRYYFELPRVESFSTIIVPKIAAPGKPWVFRADLVAADNAVDQALLAKGYHIVTGSVPYNSDGPVLEQWNTIYNHLVAHGFSKKPI